MTTLKGKEPSGSGFDLGDGVEKLLHIHNRAPEIVALGAFVVPKQTGDKCLSHIFHKLHILPAAVIDQVGTIQGQTLESSGRFAGHADITAHAVDGPRPKPHTFNAMFPVIDKGIALVTNLKPAVMGARIKRYIIRQWTCWIGLGRAKNSRARGIHNPLYPVSAKPGGFQNIERATHIYGHSQMRVLPTSGHL